MIQTCKAIVLHKIAHGETSLVVHVYTYDHGLQAFYVPGVRSKKSKISSVYFLPLQVVQISADFRKTDKLLRFREIGLHNPHHTLHYDPIKQTVAMFMAEVLRKTLHKDLVDEPLFLFLEETIDKLNEDEKTTLFPHRFLLELSGYLGFYPDDSPGDLFDLSEGCFVALDQAGTHTLSSDASTALKWLLDKSGQEPTKERHELLQNLIRYYQYHYEDLGRLKSLDVIQEILRG